jgi:type I restriction enzyme, S subunit
VISESLNIPSLRFSDHNVNWDHVPLGKIGSFKNGLNKDKADFGFGVEFVNLMDVFGKSILSEANYGLVNANENETKLYNLLKGDVLFIRSSVKRTGVGETSLIPEDLKKVVYSGFLIRFREYSPMLDLHFKRYCFTTQKFRKRLLSFATTSANTNINQESLEKIILSFPSLSEQQKIAAFLSAVDQKIQLLQRKKELLEQYKKGIMQKLFSQEIRFKREDGSDYPDWEEKKLGEYIDLLSGFAFKGSTITENPSGKPLLRGINITEGEIRHSNEMDRYYLGPTDMLNKYIVIENDLVIGMDGSKVGKNSALISQVDEGALLVQRVARIRPTVRSNIRYIYQLIRSPRFIRYVDTVNTSSGIPHISLKQIRDFIVPIPSLNEQNNIADLLMEMDTNISLTRLSISSMNYFKKGLLQQMFV